jgi:hypothetical protein
MSDVVVGKVLSKRGTFNVVRDTGSISLLFAKAIAHERSKRWILR